MLEASPSWDGEREHERRTRVGLEREWSFSIDLLLHNSWCAGTRFGQLGIDVEELSYLRRPLLRTCLDWSERQRHLAGALGAALAARLFELGWIKRRPTNRSVQITPLGQAQLVEFGLEPNVVGRSLG